MGQDIYSNFLDKVTWFLVCISSLYKGIMYFRLGLNDILLLLFFRVYVVFNNINWLSNKSYNKINVVLGGFYPAMRAEVSLLHGF